ncbi:MAG: HAD hydrolase-like protein, partial [Burkholderiales bacterium]|nr:HAD hydrolase-like protein [Burkholderiales bacterium]
LYVGDDLYFDVEGAQQAGLRAVWIQRDSNKAIDQRHAHITYEACCSDLHQLYQWLQQDRGKMTVI